jgi:glutamate formiminotransferase / 5-formyltetrahydrofolate cyclo-ligase
VLECVIKVSEGRDRAVVAAIAGAAGDGLLDVHSDPHHNRSVLTLAGAGVEEAARSVATEAVRRIDLRLHVGVHPRLGAVDVVPFVPLAGSSMDDAVAARDGFTAWAGVELGVPCFLYGPERTLPDVRRHAFTGLAPDRGPAVAHPTAGAICVGARPVLVAYNVWLAEGVEVAVARRIAKEIRGPGLRALGLDVGGRAQVSMNLVDPDRLTPADAYEAVAARAPVDRAELVGLVPASVLDSVPSERWTELDLDDRRTLPG